MIIAGIIGSLASLLYFFLVKMKTEEQLVSVYNEAVNSNSTLGTSKAINSTILKNKAESIETKINNSTAIMDELYNGTETAYRSNETELMYSPENIDKTEMMNPSDDETELMVNDVDSTELMNTGAEETFFMDNN